MTIVNYVNFQKIAILSALLKSYHHGDLKNALIRAGLEILTETGISDLSLRKVAKRAGVSEAAPYRHYKDKEALLAGIAEQGFLRLSALLEQTESKHEDEPMELFYQMGITYLLFARTNPDSMRIMFRNRNHSEATDATDLQEGADRVFNYFIDLVEYCQQEQIAKDGHPLALALSYWTSIHGLSILLIDNGISPEITQTQSDETLTRNTLNNVLHGWQGLDTP